MIIIISYENLDINKVFKFSLIAFFISIWLHFVIVLVYINYNCSQIINNIQNSNNTDFLSNLGLFLLDSYKKIGNKLYLLAFYVIMKNSSYKIPIIKFDQYIIFVYIILFIYIYINIYQDKILLKKKIKTQKIYIYILLILIILPIINAIQFWSYRLSNYLNWNKFNENSTINIYNNNPFNSIEIKNNTKTENIGFINELNLNFSNSFNKYELYTLENIYNITINNNIQPLNFSIVFKFSDNPIYYNVFESNFFHILVEPNTTINGYNTDGFIPKNASSFWSFINAYLIAYNSKENNSYAFCLSNTIKKQEEFIYINENIGYIKSLVQYVNDAGEFYNIEGTMQIMLPIDLSYSPIYNLVRTNTQEIYTYNYLSAPLNVLNGYKKFTGYANYIILRIEIKKDINASFLNNSFYIYLNGLIIGKSTPFYIVIRNIIIFDSFYILILIFIYRKKIKKNALRIQKYCT